MWFIACTSSSFITLASQFIIIYHMCIIQSPRLRWHQRAVIHSSTRGSTKTSGFDKLSWNSFSCLICWAFATFPLLIFYLKLFAGPIKCQFLKWHHWWPAARNPPSRLFIILNIIISPQSFFFKWHHRWPERNPPFLFTGRLQLSDYRSLIIVLIILLIILIILIVILCRLQQRA